MTRVAIVFHSGYGHTRVLAEAAAQGAGEVAGVDVALIAVEDIADSWATLAAADAMIFGSPTYMGSVSAPFKEFMDRSSRIWLAQGWRDKLAAGFTNSSAASGDKLGTLVQLAVFAAQHGMIWVSLGLPAGNASSSGSERDLNRLGSHLGAMAQSLRDLGSREAPPEADRRTAAHLGRRVAEAALRWRYGKPAASTERSQHVHPVSEHWQLPPAEREPLPETLTRTNLRALEARPDRYEHHLMVIGRVGPAQIEVATASEPLYFAHANISDEYAITLPTGDDLLDGLPLRTFLSDPASGDDVLRIRHRVGDLVLHPHGFLHWPGRLRAPYEPPDFGPIGRRALLSLVFCASRPLQPGERPLFVDREGAIKLMGEVSPPCMVADTRRDGGGELARIGDVSLELLVKPAVIAPPRGGFLLLLEAALPNFPCDLIHLPEGSSFDASGVERALLIWSGSSTPEAPPPSWFETPAPPLAAFEDGPPGRLPVRLGELEFEARGTSEVAVSVAGGEIGVLPRYWLARFLFRIPYHDFRLGYVETYGGFYYDDRGGDCRFGMRGGPCVSLSPVEALAAIERLYRAVAPLGYVERLA